jgi:type III pantothenate kinase
MRLVAVDIGNSAAKVGLSGAEPDTWDSVTRWSQPREYSLAWTDPARWLICSVHRGRTEQLVRWIAAERPADQVRVLNWRDVPLRIDVRQPERVGLDRLCAALAAHRAAGRRPCVAIDAGTAVTIDAVSAEGTFLGGTIFLGVQGALDQLASATDALPRLDPPRDFSQIDPLGKSTDQAILSGTVLSLIGAISEIVHGISGKLDQPPEIFLTGGDAQWLRHGLRFPFRYSEHLVLDGVRAIECRLNPAQV